MPADSDTDAEEELAGAGDDSQLPMTGQLGFEDPEECGVGCFA